jgi:ABC-type uncharacterized transport system involved in gliding motility auxiliary subunit
MRKDTMMRNRLISLAGLGVIALIVLAANLLAATLFGRIKIDLTEEKLFTLSDGTKEILRGLDDEIDAKFYYSKTAINKVPFLSPYAARVLEMLREYESVSKGKFRLEILEPLPDTEIEESAERFGLQGVSIQSADPIFLGLALRDSGDNRRVIPFFLPEREPTLEYEISNLIYSMSATEKKRIGVISSMPVTGGAPPMMNPMAPPPPQRPWALIRELKNNHIVEDIPADADEIPANIDMLLIIHPKDLAEPLQYAIDQYVLKGGRVTAFIDPMLDFERQNVNPQDMQTMMQTSFSSNMPELLKAWGVAMDAGDSSSAAMMGGTGASYRVVADLDLAMRVQNPQTGQEQRMPVYLSLRRENLNSDEIVTNALGNVLMIMPGSISKVLNDPNITVTPLIETSDKAVTIDDTMLRFMSDPDQIIKQMGKDGARRMPACKISGRFKTAFPEGKPSSIETVEDGDAPTSGTPGQLMESRETGTIILVADVDMITDRASVQIQNFLGREIITPFNDNLSFLANVAEHLTGSSALIGLRTRGLSQRPFTRVEAIQRAAQDKWLAEEEELQRKIEEANQRLRQLQEGSGETAALSTAFAREVDKLREDRLQMQRQLREVRRQLREDVERLSSRLMILNMTAIPIIVIGLGVGIYVVRRARRRRA